MIDTNNRIEQSRVGKVTTRKTSREEVCYLSTINTNRVPVVAVQLIIYVFTFVFVRFAVLREGSKGRVAF